MTRGYVFLSLPHRGRYYIAFGVGLMLWHVLATGNASVTGIVGLCFFLSTVVWFCFRHPPAGMEIRDREWRFFVGHRRWSVPLSEIASVEILGWRDKPKGLLLKLRNGRTDTLPSELAPEIEPLERALSQRGIKLEA